MKVKGFTLVNEDKVERALNGFMNADNARVGGVTQEDGTYDDDALLAEYDKLGGLIKKGDDKVKTGSFFDAKRKQPREKPQVVFIYRVNGQEIEVADGKELPGIVKAARILEANATGGRKLKKPVASKE